MKKLENILAENMRRFGTKNINEGIMPDSSGIENELTRNNVGTYYSQAPDGYQFTTKPMHTLAVENLHIYWDSRLYAKETQEEDTRNRYIRKMTGAENYLRVNGFIAK